MARVSPPTQRVTALLDAVCAAPRHPHSLADLAKSTGVSKATGLGILNELCASGWLSRDAETKTYRPGPRLLAVGAAAEESYAPVDAARPALHQLTVDLDAPATVSVRTAHQALIVARHGPHPNRTPSLRAGLHTPLIAPGALVFFAWSDDTTLDRWLTDSPLHSERVDREQVAGIVKAARRDGYLVERLSDLDPALFALLAELGTAPIPAQLSDVIRRTLDPSGMAQYLIDRVDRRRRYDVGYVAAPVFDRSGELAFLVSVLIMEAGVAGAELERVATTLLGATAEMTAAIGGVNPWRTLSRGTARRAAAR